MWYGGSVGWNKFTSEYILEKYYVIYVISNTPITDRGAPEKLTIWTIISWRWG
jgi:hypothetical protein